MSDRIVPLNEVQRDIRRTEKDVRYLVEEVMPFMVSKIKWRFLMFWVPLWAAIAGFNKAWTIGFTVWFGLMLAHHMYRTLDCQVAINSGKRAIKFCKGYINEHYPNEKE